MAEGPPSPPGPITANPVQSPARSQGNSSRRKNTLALFGLEGTGGSLSSLTTVPDEVPVADCVGGAAMAGRKLIGTAGPSSGRGKRKGAQSASAVAAVQDSKLQEAVIVSLTTDMRSTGNVSVLFGEHVLEEAILGSTPVKPRPEDVFARYSLRASKIA